MTGALAEVGTYEIRVAGRLDEASSDLLGVLTTVVRGEPPDTMTIPTARLDQAALRGLMNRIWDFNHAVLSVARVDSHPGQPGRP